MYSAQMAEFVDGCLARAAAAPQRPDGAVVMRVVEQAYRSAAQR